MTPPLNTPQHERSGASDIFVIVVLTAIPVFLLAFGNYGLAAGVGAFAGFIAFLFYSVRKGACAELERRAAMLFELGFEIIENPAVRKEMLKLGKPKSIEGDFPYLARFKGTVDGVEVLATVQNCDIWATGHENSAAGALTLHTAVNPRIPGFRLGPPLPFGYRPLEKLLRAPLSGFIDSSLEKPWYIYSGSAQSAELNLPRSLLDNPVPDEYWTCESGQLRFTVCGDLQPEQLANALAQFGLVATHLNSLRTKASSDFWTPGAPHIPTGH